MCFCYSDSGHLDICGSSDSGGAGSIRAWKSAIAHLFLMEGRECIWRSRKESAVANCKYEAKYISMSGAGKEAF